MAQIDEVGSRRIVVGPAFRAFRPRQKQAVTVWDLYVGAELDILGRMTTLQRCSQTTAQWSSGPGR